MKWHTHKHTLTHTYNILYNITYKTKASRKKDKDFKIFLTKNLHYEIPIENSIPSNAMEIPFYRLKRWSIHGSYNNVLEHLMFILVIMDDSFSG